MSAPCPTFGFIVEIGSASASERQRIREGLAELLEANALSMNGRGERETIVTRDGSQATNADRELIIEWAKRREPSAAIHVTDIIDVGEI